MNHKLNDLIKNTDIVGFVKSKRIAWLGHVMRMEEKECPKEYWSGNQQVGETKEDQGKDGLRTTKQIYR